VRSGEIPGRDQQLDAADRIDEQRMRADDVLVRDHGVDADTLER
jgi:hypothetical protein